MLNRPAKGIGEGLVFHELANNPPYILISKSHPLAQKEYVTLEDLRRAPFIQSNGHSFFISEFFAACAEAGFYPNIMASWPYYSAVMATVADGSGYTLGGNFVSVPYEEDITRVRLEHRSFRHVVGFAVNPENPKIKEIESYIRAVKAL